MVSCLSLCLVRFMPRLGGIERNGWLLKDEDI